MARKPKVGSGTKRKAIPIDVRMLVLHEAGYRCANPNCRSIITIDIHHIEYVANGGGNGAENLLPLCPNCHALHHSGEIPVTSIRAWKMLLLSLNQGFSMAALDLLLALDHLGQSPILVTTDTTLMLGSLISSGYLSVEHPYPNPPQRDFTQSRFISLSVKGRAFVDAWKAGDQQKAIETTPAVSTAPPSSAN